MKKLNIAWSLYFVCLAALFVYFVVIGGLTSIELLILSGLVVAAMIVRRRLDPELHKKNKEGAP